MAGAAILFIFFNCPWQGAGEYFDPNHQAVNLNKFVNEHVPGQQTKRIERLYRHVVSHCMKQSNGPNAPMFASLVTNSELVT